MTNGTSNNHSWRALKSSKGGSRRGLHFSDVDICYAGEVFIETESYNQELASSWKFYQNIADTITATIDENGKWPNYPKIDMLTKTSFITIEWQKIGIEEMYDYMQYGPLEWKKWSKASIISATDYLNTKEFQEFLQRTESVNHVLKSELFSIEFKQFVIKNLIKTS